MNDSKVLEKLSAIDAYAPGTQMPATAWSRDTALAEIERRMGMEPRKSTGQETDALDPQQLTDTKTPSMPGQPLETKKATRGRFLVGVGAALVLIVALGTWGLVGGGEDAASEVAVAESSYEARNNGDIGSWFALLTEQAAAQEDRDLQQIFVNMNAQTEFIEPCRLIAPNLAGEAEVACTVKRTNDFHGAGGLSRTVTETFFVKDDGHINAVEAQTVEIVGSPIAFSEAFWGWLTDAYPAVYAEIRPPLTSSLPGHGTDPDNMLVALEYVDEFVAQSDEYPISP